MLILRVVQHRQNIVLDAKPVSTAGETIIHECLRDGKNCQKKKWISMKTDTKIQLQLKSFLTEYGSNSIELEMARKSKIYFSNELLVKLYA